MRDNEKYYRDLVENSLDLICTHDLNGVLQTVNPAAARALGYEPDEVVNRNVREFLSPKSHEEFDAFLAAMRDEGRSAGFMRLRTKSGQTRIWRYTSTLRTEGVPAAEVAILLAEAVRKLADEVGMPKGLAELGVTDDLVPQLARLTLKDACLATNPRPADARDIEALFRAAL